MKLATQCLALHIFVPIRAELLETEGVCAVRRGRGVARIESKHTGVNAGVRFRSRS